MRGGGGLVGRNFLIPKLEIVMIHELRIQPFPIHILSGVYISIQFWCKTPSNIGQALLFRVHDKHFPLFYLFIYLFIYLFVYLLA
jgi:hypothetical protein